MYLRIVSFSENRPDLHHQFLRGGSNNDQNEGGFQGRMSGECRSFFATVALFFYRPRSFRVNTAKEILC